MNNDARQVEPIDTRGNMERDKTKNGINGFDEMPIIYSYTRAQAIKDGVLIDATKLAQEAGFKVPVALTAGAWNSCVQIPEGVTCQDETGRLWDVLNVLRFAIAFGCLAPNEGALRFSVSVRNNNHTNEDVKLKALCGPGDDAEPVVTIMLPHED